jgi:predicted amidohydrolase YtcJ
MMELVRERARVTPPGAWIIGQGWNEGNFSDKRLPTRHDIDPATSEHPVILMRFFNTDVVNSCALRMAGIDRHTPDPEGGKIERDADPHPHPQDTLEGCGAPNGLLRASAKGLVRRLIPPPTTEQIKESLRLGCQEMHRFGITSVVEPGLRPPEIRAYQSFYQDGGLTVRTSLMPSWHGFYQDEEEAQLDDRARALGIFTGLGDEWLRTPLTPSGPPPQSGGHTPEGCPRDGQGVLGIAPAACVCSTAAIASCSRATLFILGRCTPTLRTRISALTGNP